MGRTTHDDIPALEKAVNAYYQTKHSGFFRFFCCVNDESDCVQFKKHCELASLYAAERQYDKAITALDKALAESIDNVFIDKKEALSTLLSFGLQSNEPSLLEKAYQCQLKHGFYLTNRQRREAYQGLFQVYVDQVHFDKAISLYENWMTTPCFDSAPNQTKSQGLLRLGDLLFKKQDWEKAHACYLNAERVMSTHRTLMTTSPEHQRIFIRLLMTSSLLDKKDKQSYYKKVLSQYKERLDDLPEMTIRFKGDSRQYNHNEYLKFALRCFLSHAIFEKEDLPFEFEYVSNEAPSKEADRVSILKVKKDASKNAELSVEKPLKEYEKIRKKLTNKWENIGVGGYKETLSQIQKALIEPRAFPKEIQKKIRMPPKAAIFYGPPGTGKTYIAKRICEHFFDKAHVTIINGPELFSPLVGNSEARMRGLFEKAASVADETFVYVFDEIESLIGKRSTSDSVGATVGNRLTSTLLTILDGVDSPSNILVIGVTNFKENLDEALLRSGRMGAQFEIGLPNYEDRLAILKVQIIPHIEAGIVDPHLNFNILARDTVGFSAADIKELKERAIGDIYELLITYDDEGDAIVHELDEVNDIQVGDATFQKALTSFKHTSSSGSCNWMQDPHINEKKPPLRRVKSARF